LSRDPPRILWLPFAATSSMNRSIGPRRRNPPLVRARIVREPRRDEQIAPVGLRECDRRAQLVEAAAAELERREPMAFERSRVDPFET
jgi:hypothetical protein